MCLTKERLASSREHGFARLLNYFSQTEVELMKAELPSLFRVVERLGGVTRSVYGSHLSNDLFRCLT